MDLPTLRSHFETLRKSSKEARDANDTKECWDLLTEYAREAVHSESDRVFVATLLFDRQNGIFVIIDQSLRSQGKLARQLHIDILAYITSLLEALGPTEGSPHAAFILEKCLHFFKRFELAAVKAATFGPILEILGWNAEVLLKLKLDPCGMAHSCQREYAVNKKLSNTVKGGILQVLGSIFDQFSEEFISGVQFDCEWLQRECLAVLEKSKTQNFPEAYVAGALSGLAATLIHEDGRNPEALRIGYDHIKRALQPSNVQAVHRYLGLRGAMKILTQCASEFGHTLTKDLTLLDYLVQLRSKHSNKMVRNSSEEALNAVFKQISKDLSSGAAISDFDPFDTTSRLLGILGDMLSGSNSDTRELMVAVSGIGHLAEPCKKFFGQQGLQKLLADLAPLVDAGHVLETIEDLQEAAVVSDMILLVALGRIVQSLDIVDHSTMEMCQNVVGRIIGSYLNLWPRQHQTVHDSIVQMLLSLQQHPLALQSMTQFFANILLTHTLRPPTGKIFSGPLAVNSPEEISRDGWSTYLKIWLAVLKREHLGEEAKAALEGQPPLGSADSISTLTYDCLLRLILDALRNLDVGYDAVRDDGVGQLDAGGGADETQVLAAEVGFGLQASNRDDMLTFMVLSDFTCTILRDCGPLAFQPWSQIVTVELVAGSTKHPLLPGYYKMLTENVKLCHAMGMFDLSSQEDGIDAYVKQLCSGVFREYLLEVLVACRRYAGELLCSCLTLLLTSPALLLPSHQISTPVKLALSLGLQHPEVAYVALTALEAMETDGVPIKPTMILEILPSVVPYLRESIKIGDSKNNHLNPRKKDYSDVEETQRRILLWLGRQGGIIHNMIGNGDGADGKQTDYDGANWDPEKRLGLKIEFPEMKQMSTIWLDAMIPQASMLAEASGDRSCRVSACELLHSVILWMVGTNAGRPMSRTDEDFQPVPTRFHKILKRLLPVALRLAVSPEPVAKQLFEPLIFTLIHWLTRSARREAAETMCLLDAIMVGLGDETSGALRELCARAAAEFLKWSAKHVPKQTTGDSHGNNLNAASLLRRLFDRLSHPQPYHRLGAALALGHCARVLRNEEDLMEDYALEALHYCVHALRIAEGDAMGSGTLKQTSHAVSAIVHHCITKCSQNLMNENPNRAGFASLGVFLEWLWKKTICLEASCRRRCMLLHRKLAEAALQNEDRDMDVGPSGQWWKKYALATGQSERRLLHEFLHLSAVLSVSDSEPMSVSRLRLWLKSLDGALEWTVWALDEGIVSVDAVQALSSSLDERNVIAGLGAFFEFISDPSMVSSAEWGTTSPPLSGCDREAQDVAIAALDLLTNIDCASLGFDPTHLNRFLAAALFAPGLIGLRPSDEKLHRRIALDVCSVIRASLATSSGFSTQLARSIGSFVSNVLSNRRETSTQLSQETWLEALGPVGAVTFCNGVSLLLGIFSTEGVPLLSPTEAKDLPRQCLDMVMKKLSEGNMSHIEKQTAEGCVSLSIQLGLPATELLSVVLESEQSAKLYNAFPSVLHRWILFNAEMCCPKICSALCQQGPVSLTAEAMLAGTFDSLAHSEMISGRIDPLHASFRSCVLSSMGPCAVMLKNTDSQAFAKTMVRILKTLVGGGNGSWLSPAQAGYSSILDAFLALLALRDRKSAPIRSQALQLLPSFLAFQESADRIVTAVDSMVTDVFPSISSSMKRGSTNAREYAMQLKELLNAAANAAERNHPDIAIKLLEILLPVIQELGSTKGHIYQDAVETRLALFAAAPWIQTPKEQNPSGTLDAMKDVHETVRSLISYAWDVVFVRKGLSVALKRATCRWVLIPLLECSSVEIVRGFFSDRILKIVEGAEKPITLVEGEGLVTRLCAFMLLERMYCLLRKDVLESDILSQLPKKNQTVMKLCVNQAKEIGTPSSDFKELYRQVCCAAFCAASSLLVLTQTNPKFFTLALQGKKGSPPTQLWRNMMAIDQSLSFSVESVGEGSKAQIARASNAVARVEQYTKGHSGGFLGPGATLGNLTFAQTTLSVKIASSQFSLGMEDELPPEKSLQTKRRGMDEAPSTPPRKSLEMAQTTQDIWGGLGNSAEATTPETGMANQVLPFYEDELDKHESILALVQLIERASEVPCSNDKDLPIWQTLISLQSAAVPRYAKIFLCKAIIHIETRHMSKVPHQNDGPPQPNSHDAFQLDMDTGEDAMEEDEEKPQEAPKSTSIFSRFAEQFFPPMLDAITDDLTSEGSSSTKGTFHYLLRDLCLVWLRWGALFERASSGALKYESEIGGAGRKLMRHLLLVGFSSNADVLRVNFEYIRAFVGQWGACVPLPIDALLMHIQPSKDAKKSSGVIQKQMIFGLKLMAVALKYGQGEGMIGGPQSEGLWKGLLSVFQFSRPGSRLCRQAGETTGLFVRAISKHSAPPIQLGVEKVEMEVKDGIRTLFGKFLHGSLLVYLDGMSEFYPSIVDASKTWIINVLLKVDGKQRTTALEILRRRARQLPDLFFDITREDFLGSMLVSKFPEVQFSILGLVRDLLPLQAQEPAAKVVGSVVHAFVNHANEKWRIGLFELLRDAWQLWPDADVRHKHLKGPLVALLSDENQEVYRELVKFWHSILPQTHPERLQALLALSIDPGSPWTEKIQRRWPQVASALLLELPKSTPTYEKAVFETSLAECKFMDYSVNTWQGPNTATMFSMGTTSYSQDPYSLAAFGGSPSKMGQGFQGKTTMSPNRVRATMASTLTPTIALSLPVESSMGQSAHQEKASNSPPREQRAHLRRRVYKSSGVEAGIAATLRRGAAERKRQEERQSRVQLYRTYRAGELPDIQGIKVSGFVGPLAQIAVRDTTTACALVAAIAKTVFDEIQQTQGNVRTLEGIHQQVDRCLSSKSRHSGYVQCLAGIVVAGRGIWISPESLVSSARSSGEYQAMAFVVEKQMVDPPLIAALESKKPSSRRPGTVRTYPVAAPLKTDGDAWMCLAESFREMGKGDFLHVIRMGHLTKCPGSRRALMALQSGRAAVALDLCEKLLEAYDEGMVEDPLIGGQEVSPAEANIWYDDKMECLEKLGCWRVLQDQIGLELDETGEVLEQNIGRLVSSKEEDKHLGRYLRPFVRSCLFQRTEQNTLALLLDPIKTNREKMGVVHATIPAELACIHAVRSEWTAASADLRASLKSFCMQWSGTNVGSSDARHSLLSLLQPMSEAQEVVETVLASRREDGSILVLGGDVEKCVRQWLIRWPNASHGQEEQALAIVSFRELMLRAIQPIACLNGKDSSTFLFIRKLLQELKLHAASCYQSQGMLDLAQELLEECRLEFIGKQNIDVLPYLVTKVEVCVAKIKQPLEHEAALYSTLNRDLEELAGYKNSMERSVEFQLRAAVIQGEGYWLAAHQPGASGSDRSLKSSNSFKKWMEAVQSGHSEHVEGVAKAALGFALLCNELIEESEETASTNVTFQGMSEEVKGKIDSWGGLSATMVSTLLHSMALGCSDASLYVPRILTAMIHDVMSREEFAKGWRGVPLSAFLPWVSQMMGQLEEDMGSFLVPCLEGLAEEYPQHLYFPFHLCQANLQSDGKSRMRSFEEKLNIPVLKDFADALHKLTYPVQRWEGYEALIVRALQSGDKNEASRIFRDEAIPDLFTCDSGQAGGLGRNNINAKFSKAYKAAFTSAFGTDGRKIASMNSDTFRKKSRQIVTKAKDDLSKQQGKCELSLFTPWFSDFTTSYSSEASGGTKLFLPRMASVGGGGGFHDVAVVGFGKMVDIFSSKQKPKKLTIYAEDFTAYEFVVKGGEELRIDQRVEQLFGVMNGLAARNPAAASRNLKMRTYDVIPLSPTLGLLAFVDGTRPLESVMVPGTIPQSEYKKSAEVFQSFITKGMGGYENVFKKSNREYVISHFENAESFVPWDGLREALVRYSGSPEGFIRFREVFLQSLSVSCVMGYIAGVGDRHLQNFLVEETSGTLIPIDFGYSFGTATQVLPIPELMPFRLTRQLIGVSAPHDGKAILAMYMKEIMVALRQGRQVIEGIMEAFLREPLLDWQREAQVLSKIKGKKVAQGDVEHREEMHAQLKVEHSKQKLRGKHPVDIMLSELAGRHGGKPYWRTLEAIVRGHPNTNGRAQVKCKGGGVLSCEEQVECLLDQATDGNILGRTWWGWRPWI